MELDLELGVVVGGEGRGDDDVSRRADPYYEWDVGSDAGRDLAGDAEANADVADADSDDAPPAPAADDADDADDAPPPAPAAEARAAPPSPRPPSPPPVTWPRTPTLFALAARAAASSLEGYPPAAFGALSEAHWDAVVRARAAAGGGRRRAGGRGGGGGVETAGKKGGDARQCWWAGGVRGRNHVGDDEARRGKGDGGGVANARSAKLPALAERFLLAIEGHPGNTHLARSAVADELLWRVHVEVISNCERARLVCERHTPTLRCCCVSTGTLAGA